MKKVYGFDDLKVIITLNNRGLNHTKQKIILHRYRDGYSERRIAGELRINRTTVRRYLAEYAKAKENLSGDSESKEELIEEIVKLPKYDTSNRGSKKFTYELRDAIDSTLVRMNYSIK